MFCFFFIRQTDNPPPEKVGFKVAADEAPYILTKPIHRNQRTLETLADGSVVLEIEVVINHELEREFLGYANGLRVLYPQRLAEIMHKKLKRAAEQYD